MVFQKGQEAWNKGKKWEDWMSPESREKVLSNLNLGNPWNKGKKYSEELRKKVKKQVLEAGKNTRFDKGKSHWNWQGGKTSWRQKIVNTKEYKEWRRKVLERDNYQCRECPSKERLQAHHIVPVRKDRTKIFELDNGKTLCYDCHSEKHPDIFLY